jgi:hypothetical protein
MSPENCATILERIREAGKNLEGKLPPSWKHPKGRNPYAHIPKVIKSLLGCSYKDAEDDALDVILEIIDHCEKHPF